MRARPALVLLLCLAAGCGEDKPRPTEVPLALDFTPNAVHAGVYSAAEGPADRRHGIELRIRVPSGSADSLKLLETGRADFALVDIHDLGLARERGLDVVGLGGIVQRPLAAVIARPGIARPRDLEGRRVGVTGLPSDEAVLRAVVEDDGGDYDRGGDGHDRLLRGSEPDRGSRGRGGVVLERGGGGAPAVAASDARVPGRRLRRARATRSWCWRPPARRSTTTPS